MKEISANFHRHCLFLAIAIAIAIVIVIAFFIVIAFTWPLPVETPPVAFQLTRDDRPWNFLNKVPSFKKIYIYWDWLGLEDIF